MKLYNHFLLVAVSYFGITLISIFSPANSTPIDSSSAASITNNTNSVVFGDTVKANQYWVMPPTSGVLESASSNLTPARVECEGIFNSLKNIHKLDSQLATINDAIIKIAIESEGQDDAKVQAKYENLILLSKRFETDLSSKREKYSNEFGGNISLKYDTNWNENVERLKTDNPTFLFQQIETKNLDIRFVIPGSIEDGSSPAKFPIIDSYSVQGVKAKEARNAGIGMSDELGVDLSVTKFGACFFKFPKIFDSRNESPKFSLAVTYDYPRVYKQSVTAEYNLWQLYTFLQEEGSKGGLFSSSSYKKTLESNVATSAFVINWTNEDPENKIPILERSKIETEIKQFLLADIAKLASNTIGVDVTSVGAPGKSGAKVLSSDLMLACGANAYCAASAVALRALDAIFGSSKSTLEYKKLLDIKTTYTTSLDQARYVTYGTNFVFD